MSVVKYVTIFTLILSFTGCTRQFHIARIIPGKTTDNDTVKYLGTPHEQGLQRSSFNSSDQILTWDDVQVQFKNHFVVAVHRTPAGHEESLQFWRQHYKESVQNFNKVKTDFTSDHVWQLDLPQHGINVIYDETQDKVVKVVYYEIR